MIFFLGGLGEGMAAGRGGGWVRSAYWKTTENLDLQYWRYEQNKLKPEEKDHVITRAAPDDP
jgi:hypothetical protein